VARARFGTDGVRGVANAELTAELAVAIGRAAARIQPAATFLVGRDTRRSGSLLQAALSAGLATEGADVLDVGVIPTPGVAFLAEQKGFPGAMVSASHNPFADNGIKLFSAVGTKLLLETEAAIETEIVSILQDPDGPPKRPTGHGIGRIGVDHDGADAYRAHLRATLDDRSLAGLSVVLDCANGAASDFAPDVFSDLGAKVSTIHAAPDGANINDNCGSTNPQELAAAVLAAGADLGLAFDGDADRVIAIDHNGVIADGDTLLALFAVDLSERGKLSGNAVVVTVMTNLGFRHAMTARGIAVKETPVGDRHVLAALDAEGLALGGEQSGHIVFRHRSSAGDGILTGLALSDLLCRSGRRLSELADGLVERVPQVLVNVTVPDPGLLAEAQEVWRVAEEIQEELGESGRVLLRPSGTEPLVRVMIEAKTTEQANESALRLSDVVQRALGALPG
jgi:phosphoglucosamine mutase